MCGIYVKVYLFKFVSSYFPLRKRVSWGIRCNIYYYIYRASYLGGRMKWQISNGYGKRSLVETARYKSILGRRLRARSRPGQQTKASSAAPFSTHA
ncbi:hypothetical protein GFM02_16965 [Rhizobium leguminosarum bv. viciae]|nr:hypothetical protein [Rhizobium leguminosarum bv. viciae]